MAEIVVFGGTAEGRVLSEALSAAGVDTLVCVATEYGEALLGGLAPCVRVREGRLDEAGMRALLERERPRLVLDATHPYAAAVSENLRRACAGLPSERLRVLRPSVGGEGALRFPDMAALTDWLLETPGVVFSALGAKEAAALCRLPDYRERVFLRILPARESLERCLSLGYPPAHLLCLQGPFSRELDAALFRHTKARILLTKDSGAPGGCAEKLAAAAECGMFVAVLARPQKEGGADCCTLEEALARILPAKSATPFGR